MIQHIAAWMVGILCVLGLFVEILVFATAQAPFPTYRLIQIPVQTSSGEALCSVELFNHGNPTALLLGCDAGDGSGT